MEKNSFVILFCTLLVVSYSQLSEPGLNQPRKLSSDINETVLLGFDNYTIGNIGDEHNDFFNTYFLLRNWNFSNFKNYSNDKYNNFTLGTIISYKNKSLSRDSINFICLYNDSYNENGLACTENYATTEYCIVKYLCSSNSTSKDFVKRINITTNFSEWYLNGIKIDNISSSAEALEKDLTSLRGKELFKKDYTNFLRNTIFIYSSPGTFKIKGEIQGDDDYESKKAHLITMSNGIAKNITCIVENKIDDNDEKYYYYLYPKGSGTIPNSDLQYAVVHFPVKDKSLILDFKDRSNTVVEDNKEYKMSSGGLSTGGIIAVAIPTCAVLLGVAGLSFFLSRRIPTAPPQLKNINQNNTMGVVASSEAIIHQ